MGLSTLYRHPLEGHPPGFPEPPLKAGGKGRGEKRMKERKEERMEERIEEGRKGVRRKNTEVERG